MGIKDLEKFLNDKKNETSFDKEKIEERINLWQKQVENFYKNVELWLKILKDKKFLTINYDEINKTEEFLGTYKIRKMLISIGNEILEIEPAGALVIGALGRIDLNGKNGNIRFVLVLKNSNNPKLRFIPAEEVITTKKEIINYDDYTWKIATYPPNINYIDLNSDNFSNVILDMIK